MGDSQIRDQHHQVPTMELHEQDSEPPTVDTHASPLENLLQATAHQLVFPTTLHDQPTNI